MRYVERDRVALPKYFASEEAFEARWRLVEFFDRGAEAISQTRYTSETPSHGDFELFESLMEHFDGRCAFCESRVHESGRPNKNIYRFRPPFSAEPVYDRSTAHLYYIWLRVAWQNLYLICEDCFPDNPSYFPLERNRRVPLPSLAQLKAYAQRTDGRWPDYPLREGAVLLDPCLDDKLWQYFRFYPDGSVAGRHRRGNETIAHFKLDRGWLTHARAEIFKEYLGSAKKALADGIWLPWDVAIEKGDGSYGGAWKILLQELLALALGTPAYGSLDIMGSRLARMPDSVDRFQRAVQTLQNAPFPELAGAGLVDAEKPKTTSALPTKFRLTNFKSLENIDLVLPRPGTLDDKETAPSLLILGENAAGKSTILEGIALAMMSAEQRRLLGLQAGRLVLNPKYMGDPDQPAAASSVITTEYSEGEKAELTVRPQNDTSHQKHFATDFTQTGPQNALPLFAYGAFRQYLDVRHNFSKHRFIRSLFQHDYLLSNPEKWLLNLKNDDFNMVARALREVFSVEGKFDILEHDGKKVYVVTPLNNKKQRTPIGIVSSGFRAVVAMLCDIMQGLMDKRINPDFQALETAKGLVLIDEVEAHLHPRWKLSIMGGLRRALPRVTFIATSHDPLCLRSMGKDEVMVLERIAGHNDRTSLPVFTQSLVDLPDNQNWTIEQLLTADFFMLRSTENAEAEQKAAAFERRLAEGEDPANNSDLNAYLHSLTNDLPIGRTDVERIVHDAIREFLVKRKAATTNTLSDLRKEAKRKIIAALEFAK